MEGSLSYGVVVVAHGEMGDEKMGALSAKNAADTVNAASEG